MLFGILLTYSRGTFESQISFGNHKPYHHREMRDRSLLQYNPDLLAESTLIKKINALLK